MCQKLNYTKPIFRFRNNFIHRFNQQLHKHRRLRQAHKSSLDAQITQNALQLIKRDCSRNRYTTFHIYNPNKTEYFTVYQFKMNDDCISPLQQPQTPLPRKHPSHHLTVAHKTGTFNCVRLNQVN